MERSRQAMFRAETRRQDFQHLQNMDLQGMFYPQPQPGDLIEIPCDPFFKHWAIYIKDGYIIHLTPDGVSSGISFAFSSSTETAVIKKEPLTDVVRMNNWSINNRSDKELTPLPIRQIKKMANAMVGRRVYYSVTQANCEHFVHLLRYGKKKSDQAVTAVTAGIFSLLTAAVTNSTVLPVAVGLYALSKYFSEEKTSQPKTMEDEYRSAQPYLSLKRGYLIRISQRGDEYWAMYVGAGEVIYVCPEDVLAHFQYCSTGLQFGSGALANGAPSGYVIRREHLAKVAPSDHWKIDNSWDNRMEPLPKDEIIRKAKTMIGHKIKGNVNDFVKLIRYFEMPDPDPKPGDVIMILRPKYNQLAICVGDGDIIYQDSGRVVVRKPLVEVAASDLWCINNKLDSSIKPLCAKEIVRNAQAVIGQEVELSEEDFIRNTRCVKKPDPVPKPGDVIMILRSKYNQLAIYVGDGDIIYRDSGRVVVRKPLVEVAASDLWCINNKLDSSIKPLCAKEIVRNAQAVIGQEVELSEEDFIRNTRCVKKPDPVPKPGDVIMILRPKYNQLAIYVGDGDIIYRDSGHVVVRKPLVEVAASDPWCINNKLDSSIKPLCAKEIIRNAQTMIGQEVELSEEDFIRNTRCVKKPDPVPKPADVIMILRPWDNQWAIYVGHGDVIYQDSGCVVVRKPLVEVAASDPWCINNKLDSSIKPLCAKEIIRNAQAVIGQRIEMSEEDFIRYIRCVKKPDPVPKLGDVIMILRPWDNQWAIYVGDGDIIYQDSGCVVVRKPLAEVAVNDPWCINNKLDRGMKPLCAKEIIRNAQAMIGQKVELSEEDFIQNIRCVKKPDPVPKLGDVIMILRPWDNQWAIYVGDGDIIYQDSGCVVVQKPLAEVAVNDPWCINNKLDRGMKPLCAKEIIRNAQAMIGQKVELSEEDFIRNIRCVKKPDPVANPGDMIMILRPKYNQLAIYVGDGDIIYRDSGCVVMRKPLVKVAASDPWCINNKLDSSIKPLCAKEIIRNAQAMIGRRIKMSEDDFIRYIWCVKKLDPVPKHGDVITILRPKSIQWAIYVGYGDIIYRDSGRVVVKKPLVEVAANDPWCINDKLDCSMKPLRAKEIVRNAQALTGQKIESSEDDFLWYIRCVKKTNPAPKPGDVIMILSLKYNQWPIYFRDVDIIYQDSGHVVVRKPCVEVAASDPWCISNEPDSSMKAKGNNKSN